MSKLSSLEDLANVAIDEDSQEITISDKSIYSNYSKDIAITISYLLGITREAAIKRADNEALYDEITQKLEKDENAKAIRHLNNIRSNLILNFKSVSRAMRDISVDYKPVDKMELFAADFKALSRLEIRIYSQRKDINELIEQCNNEIIKRIDKLSIYFPQWVKFKNIRNLFVMPNNIEEESKKFQANQSFYPFQRYLNWNEPQDEGYILITDAMILEIAYDNCGEIFSDRDKVVDASDLTKGNITEFLNSCKKVHIFVDGENADPYKLADTINSLADWEIEKTEKITVLYDEKYLTKAWKYLENFTCGIRVELNPIKRLVDEKSLVDHYLIASVSKAIYEDKVDGVIIVSSDSDFWSIINYVKTAKFMVMVEHDKCSHSFKEILRDNDIFYCYMDKFKEIENNQYLKLVFRQELEKSISEMIQLCNSRSLLNDAIRNSLADMSAHEKENIYNQYIKNLKLVIDENGDFKIALPER